jgi:hypothetical protein
MIEELVRYRQIGFGSWGMPVLIVETRLNVVQNKSRQGHIPALASVFGRLFYVFYITYLFLNLFIVWFQ